MMSASLTDWLDYVDAVKASISPEVHPAARATIHEWIVDMEDAVRAGRHDEAANTAKKIARKADEEVRWHRHCLASADDPGLEYCGGAQ